MIFTSSVFKVTGVYEQLRYDDVTANRVPVSVTNRDATASVTHFTAQRVSAHLSQVYKVLIERLISKNSSLNKRTHSIKGGRSLRLNMSFSPGHQGALAVAF